MSKNKTNTPAIVGFTVAAAAIIGGGYLYTKLDDEKEAKNALAAEKDNLTTLVEKQSNTIIKTVDDVNALRSENAVLKNDLKNYQGRIYVLSNNLEQAQENLADLQDEYAVYQDSVGTVIAGLNESIGTAGEEKAALAEKLGVTEEDLKETQEQLALVADENGTLHAVVYHVIDGNLIFEDWKDRNELKKAFEGEEELSDETVNKIKQAKADSAAVSLPKLGL